MKASLLAAFAAVAMAAAPQAQPVQSIDPQHSKITVSVYKQGLFSFLADNHVIDAPVERGSYDAQRRSIDLVVDVSAMRVLDPHLSADKRAQVQSNMLGPQVLDAAKYPTITFQSTGIEVAASGTWTVTGNLQIHGQTHSTNFEVKTDRSDHFTGSAVVRQTAYGIRPIKIAGGAVSVKDDVRVDFDIVTRPH